MKKSTIVVPTFNEESNIMQLHARVKSALKNCDVQYRILFIDNCSKDNTRDLIRELSLSYQNVDYIFNNRNYGFSRSLFYGLLQVKTDAAVLLYADMQDPSETIIDFVKAWNAGNNIVVGIKSKSNENKIMFVLRKLYYGFINAVTDIEHIE